MDWIDTQNSVENLGRLAAQRRMYSEVKTLAIWQGVLLVAVPIGLGVAVFGWRPLEPWAALYGVVAGFLDVHWCSKAIDDGRKAAAAVQWSFDSAVLRLRLPHVAKASMPSSEEVHAAADRHKGNDGLSNWYPSALRRTSIGIGRLLCQRCNLHWDASQQRAYGNGLGVLGAVVLLALLGFAISENLNVGSWVLWLGTASPLLHYCARKFREHREVADSLDRLREHWEGLWSRVKDGDLTPDQMDTEAFDLQISIQQLRRERPPVFDWFYNRRRSVQESLMNRTTEQYLDELATAQGTTR